MPEVGIKLRKSSESLFKKSTSIPELFEHQEQTRQFGCVTPYVFDMSDAGTGKTRAWLEVLRHRIKVQGGKALVLATKTTLKSAWADDIRKFTPELTYSIAYAHNREKAFKADVDIYITNHDAVKTLQKHRRDWLEDRGFHSLIIDESTAFKHRTSQRSKALAKLSDLFQYRTLLTGTPNPNGILDLWHQVFILDGGSHLGPSYWRFRSTVCEPQQVGPSPQHVKWNDKDGAAEAVADLLEDITIRHIFEECTDIPENHEYTVQFELARDHRRAYEILKEHAVLELKEGGITAFNASIVEHRDITYGVIDGSVSAKRRTEIVDLFQAGLIRIIFAHPASAGHGLTLTRGRATIWASPVYNAEHYTQFNRRIYRIGQHHRTETILVIAEDTIDVQVARQLMGKVEKMDDLLEMLS
jgi:SNF2 family DNA or RNA helicase